MIQGHTGGYSRGDPPLPIPNREVKPANADGTALRRGRVGSRRLISGEAAKDTCPWRLPLFFFLFACVGYLPAPGLDMRQRGGCAYRCGRLFVCWRDAGREDGQLPARGWPAVPARVRLFNLSLQWKAAGRGSAPASLCREGLDIRQGMRTFAV